MNFRFAKVLLERESGRAAENKGIEVRVVLLGASSGWPETDRSALAAFPTRDQLFEYDCIVAFDPDWEQLDELHVKLLERWVAEKAGGLVVVAGPVFTPQWSSRRRGDQRTDTLKALYPVIFYSQGSATLSLGRFGSEKAWPVQFTRDGLEAEFLWLDENAAASEKAWQQFEGVCGYYAVKDTVDFHDLHATILHLLGLDHLKLTYRHAGRDFRLTDVHGRVVHEILA